MLSSMIDDKLNRWGRFPLFDAKISTGPSSLVIVRRARKFHVGQLIWFVEWSDLRGMCIGVTPPWRRGTIWKIENERLFINL